MTGGATARPFDFGPEVEALVVKELENRVKGRLALLRAIIGTGYLDGDGHDFHGPDGTKLGRVLRTNPDYVWTVVDRLSFEQWLASTDNYLERTLRVRDGDENEALAVIADHAPHLLEEAVRVREGAEREVLAECARLGKPIAPGVAHVKPEGTITVKPAKTAGAAISAMVEAGLLTWDGRRPELEGGDAA